MKTLDLLALCAALTASLPALAEFPQLSASLGYTSEVFTARQYDLVDADDHLPMFRLGAAVTLPVAVGAVDLEAAYRSGGTAEAAHTAVTSGLWLRGLEVGATWRYPLWRYLHPYVHLGGGIDWATLTLISETRLTQTVSNVAGNGLLGVQVPLALTRREKHAPTIVVDLGVGYVLRPGYAFSSLGPAPVAHRPVDPIAAGSVNVGTLPLSGITWRLLVSFRM